MSHYLEDGAARATDRLALAPLAAADPRGLYDAVRAHGISMCGYIPATVALVAARALGATRASVVGYATSADAGADSRPRRRLRRRPRGRMTRGQRRPSATFSPQAGRRDQSIFFPLPLGEGQGEGLRRGARAALL